MEIRALKNKYNNVNLEMGLLFFPAEISTVIPSDNTAVWTVTLSFIAAVVWSCYT
jgi:hypothetical protein